MLSGESGASDPPSSAVSRTAPDERRASGLPRAAHGAMARWPYPGHLPRVRRLAGIRSFHTWLRASASGSTHCRSATLGYTRLDISRHLATPARVPCRLQAQIMRRITAHAAATNAPGAAAAPAGTAAPSPELSGDAADGARPPPSARGRDHGAAPGGRDPPPRARTAPATAGPARPVR